ncbi:outer membrane lipoprotein [Klebsiella pneumoniae]|uniref:Outer membrane lipoprotein n=1 Tax=Klebsiella pneumoniae TaxID=573 RepID=A0A377UXG2_KLEPN|nr:outer membrane lipoprotein [Klebsiella pneumoniae]STT53741.1 outer membrane lipoprotein [Klebsiella pneumoniae]
MRILPIIAMALLLSGCGSIISRTVPGQGHGNQYYPGVQWMFAIRHGAISPFSTCRSRWYLIRFCCLWTPATDPITD